MNEPTIKNTTCDVCHKVADGIETDDIGVLCADCYEIEVTGTCERCLGYLEDEGVYVTGSNFHSGYFSGRNALNAIQLEREEIEG